MKVVRDLRVWIIRRRLRSAMVDLRSARTKLEKTKLMTTAFLKKYDGGPEGVEFPRAVSQSITHVSDVIDHLRPFSPARNLHEVIAEIQQLDKVERVLMARKFRQGEDSAAKG